MTISKRKKQKFKTHEVSLDGAVGDAFNEIESLKDELQSWYDNLPQAFQDGDKGSTLQEAINNMEQDSAPDVPECLNDQVCTYSELTGRLSRAKRRDNAVSMLQAAAEQARAYLDELDELTYNEDGRLVIEGVIQVEDQDTPTSYPLTEDLRDDAKTEIESFADECENAASNWEAVEFPGMYG